MKRRIYRHVCACSTEPSVSLSSVQTAVQSEHKYKPGERRSSKSPVGARTQFQVPEVTRPTYMPVVRTSAVLQPVQSFVEFRHTLERKRVLMIRRWDRWCPEGCNAPEHTSEGGLGGMAPARKALRRKRGISTSSPINCSSDVGGHEARTGSRGNCKYHWGLSGIAVATARNKGSSRRHHSRWWRLTQPCSSEPRNSICTILMLTTLAVTSSSNAADLSTEYLKPTVSSKECMEVVGLISAKTTSLGNDGACMQCDPANDVCPPGCQALVDDLYNTCDGVTTPDGLYFDPDNSIEGEWSDKVKARIKIATERCGCDDSTRTLPLGTLLGSSFASSVGLVALVSFASWFMAACLFVLPNNRR